MAERYIADRYKLSKLLQKGDKLRGIPELWEAHDAGDYYFLKLWKRTAQERGEIQALWNREVRGLMRLQGYPGANELFVHLRDLGSSVDGYYAVIDGGHRLLLSDVLRKRAAYAWLSNMADVGRRRVIWTGLLRIAQALAILHDEGTLHRSLIPASIFVDPEGQGDFRLSGFEWSLRLSGSDGASTSAALRYSVCAPELEGDKSEYSPGTDWFDFGLTASELLGADPKNARKRPAIRAAVQRLTNLRDGERSLLLSLLEEDSEHRLSTAEAIVQAIQDIIRDLNSASITTTRDLVLAIRVGPDSEFSRAIERASQGAAKASEPAAQRIWVQKDLGGDIRVVARTTPSKYYILKGKQLEYRVRNWTSGGTATWDVGFCESLEASPRTNAGDQHYNTAGRRLDVHLYPYVRQHITTIRGRSARWDGVFEFREGSGRLPSHLRVIHDFFRITEQLDTVLTAAKISPCQVISTTRTATHTFLEVSPLEEPERNDLARQLGLQSPSEQLQDWFRLGAEDVASDDEEDPQRDRYTFLDRRTISGEGALVTWNFVGASPHKDGPRYRFRALGSLNIRKGRLYLARNHEGTLAQIRRRHRATEALRSHETLLKAIADPLSATRKTRDKLPEGRAEIPLDDSKFLALTSVWQTQPLFAVQGPPGTGKTTLIKAFADRVFSLDQTPQILITAHSHHTVDDVRLKLAAMFAADTERQQPIIIRLGAREATDHDVEPVTKGLVQRLAESKLVETSPLFLRERALAIATDVVNETDEGAVDLRAMRVLVQDAANLTFCTSNSADLAELVDRGRRFDWSIIEEAGKAHGFDMAAALQESHRLLLIGDHYQLPPFNARLFTDLLADPLRVKKAIQTGAQFAPGLVDATLVEDDEGVSDFTERCAVWKEMVTLFGNVFGRSISTEETSRIAAVTLTDQHRMHPEIAELVGRVFYPDGEGGTILRSPGETFEKFKEDPPFEIKGDQLPGSRLVWCDVPWVQKKEFAEGEIDGLFVSKAEAAKVVEVLSAFTRRGDKECAVQILSPYNNQLDAIREEIDKAYQAGRLSEAFAPPFNIQYGKRMGATVDEFQGGEADVVIVSLVRNNALVPWKSVGFLKESNRMNVLLSRARQKLVVIGSWDFFDTRCDDFTGPDDEYAYLEKLMGEMKRAESVGHLVKI